MKPCFLAQLTFRGLFGSFTLIDQPCGKVIYPFSYSHAVFAVEKYPFSFFVMKDHYNSIWASSVQTVKV